MLSTVLAAIPYAVTIIPWSITAGFVTAIGRGRLIPRSWVDKLTAEKDKLLVYQDAQLSENRTTIGTLMQQNAKLSVQGEVSVAVLQSIQGPNTASNHASITDPGSGHVAPTPSQT